MSTVGNGSTSASRNRLSWVDTGRGIAILLVALLHSTQWLAGFGFDTHVLRQINEVVSSLRMPLFFTLSGLFARKWLTASWRDLFRSKLLLFIWVFALWQIISAAVGALAFAVHGEPTNVPRALLALAVSPVFPRLELWFIWALCIYFVVAKATRSFPVWAQLAGAVAVSSTALALWVNSDQTWTGAFKYYFFFLSGLYLRDRILRLGSTSRVWVLVLAFCAWLAISLTLSLLGLRDVYPLYFINCLAGVTAGIALSRALSRVAVLGYIGSRTLPIYLAHTPIILLLCAGMSTPALAAHLAPVGAVLPLFLAPLAVAGALALHRMAGRTAVSRALYEPPVAAFRSLLKTRSRSRT